MDKLRKGVAKLLKDNKIFYASLIQGMVVVEDIKCPTMGVSATKEGVHLHYNPEFIEKLPLNQLASVLEHECLHVINEHTIRREERNPQLFNMACDIAINQYIAGLPKQTLTPEQFKLPKDLASEEYYKLLEKQETKISMTLDDHSKWENGKGDKEQQKAVKDLVSKSLAGKTEEERKEMYGSVSQKISETLKELADDKPLNWKQVFAQFVQFASQTYRISTRKKPNRRYGILYPGSKNMQKLKIVCGVDTSGSISDEQLAKFHQELKYIYELKYEDITILECDTEIVREYPIRVIPKTRSASGGTDFVPVFNRAEQLNADIILYFTDGEGNYPKGSKIPVLWVLQSDYKVPFGKKVVLNGKI